MNTIRPTGLPGPTITHWLGIGLLGIWLVACSSRAASPATGREAPLVLSTQTVSISEPEKAADITPANTALQQERLIIRNGNIVLVVQDSRAAHQAIEALVNELAGEGAFVVSSSERGSGVEQLPYINLQIRVPATHFDTVMDELAALALDVRDRAETAQDVTEEYVDVKSRLEALDVARQRLQEIMENAATTEDLLAAEAQLTQREAEIESLQGRLNYLTQSAALSSITIELIPDLPSQPLDLGWRPSETARRAIDALIESAQGVADFVIFFGIACLPWLAIAGVFGFGAFRWWRGRRKKVLPKVEDEGK